MVRLIFCSLSAMAFATAASAQGQAVAPAAAGNENPQASVPGESKGIADIIVTASRRAESAQRAALSIQAISGDALVRAGVTKPEDLNAVATGVQIGTAASFPQVYIRGVGSFNTQSTGDSAVALSLDGVFISRPWAARGMFYDLERVEVLKGPQGTLYGRNASGGAVNIITAKPKLGEFTGFGEFQFGNYNDVEGSAALNIPLGTTVAMRLSGQVVSRDGYLPDGYDDNKTQAVRLQLLWNPTGNFSILLNGNYQHTGGKGAGPVLSPDIRGEKFVGASDPDVAAIFQTDPITGPLNVFPRTDGYLDVLVKAVGAEIKWNLGFATLTVLPAYRVAKFRGLSYIPGFSAENNEHNDQTTVEARLGNDNRKLKWVLGGYYFNENGSNLKGSSNLVINQGVAALVQQTLDLNTVSAAVFGQATYSLTDRFRVTGGLRYTYERKKFAEFLVNYGLPTPLGSCPVGSFDPTTPFPPLLLCRLDISNDESRTYRSVTWKAGVEYDIAPRSMAYASVSTGFKSGGFYSAPPPNQYGQEKMTAFELGIKNRFFNNRLQFNVEGFFWRYLNHQESYIGPTSVPGFFTFLTVNAGRAKTYGAAMDALLQATLRDDLSLRVQYNKTRYDTFSYSYPSGNFGPVVTGCTATPFTPSADQSVDCSGKPLVRAPLWVGTASYSHTFGMGSHGDIRASFNLQFASSSYLSTDFLEAGKQNAYATGEFDLGYTSRNGRISVTAFVHNIWNEEVKTQALRSPFVTSANPLANPDGVFLATVRPPRTFGGRVRYNF